MFQAKRELKSNNLMGSELPKELQPSGEDVKGLPSAKASMRNCLAERRVFTVPCLLYLPWKYSTYPVIDSLKGKHNKDIISANGSGSKNRYQNGTLLSGNRDQHLRNPSCLILSRTQMEVVCALCTSQKKAPFKILQIGSRGRSYTPTNIHRVV